MATSSVLDSKELRSHASAEQGVVTTRLFSEVVGSEGSHDDFKPESKEASAVPDVFDTIKKDISTHRVFLYMKVSLRSFTSQISVGSA